MKISELRAGAPAEGFFSVKYKHPLRPYQKGFRFELGVADGSAETEVTYWGGPDQQAVRALYNSLPADGVVFVKGRGDEFKGALKISVNEPGGEIRKAREGEFRVEDLLPVSNRDIPRLFREILSAAESAKNPYVKALLLSFLEDAEFAEKLRKAPAAMYNHHACIGGLVEHVWGVMRLCEAECEVHPSLDRDLAIAGAILHDVGKLQEFSVTTNIRVSEEGMLRGHLSIGEEMVAERISRIPGFPGTLRLKILHMMISHHGKKEYGSPKEPQFPEAKLVSMADELDATLSPFILAKKSALAETEDFRTYSKKLGEIYLR